MVTLQSGLLPSNYLHPPNSSLTISTTQNRFNVLPPKFSFRASTARNLALKQSVVSTHRNPDTHLVDTPKIGKDCNNSTSLEQNSEGDGCLSLLYLFNVRCSWLYDSRQVHAQFVKLDALSWNSFIGNKLTMLYWRREESLNDAHWLFDEIPERTVPVYAALIVSYCRSARWEELFAVFGLMVRDWMLPDKYLVPTILKACSAVQSLRTGKMVYTQALAEPRRGKRDQVPKTTYDSSRLCSFEAGLHLSIILGNILALTSALVDSP